MRNSLDLSEITNPVKNDFIDHPAPLAVGSSSKIFYRYTKNHKPTGNSEEAEYAYVANMRPEELNRHIELQERGAPIPKIWQTQNKTIVMQWLQNSVLVDSKNSGKGEFVQKVKGILGVDSLSGSSNDKVKNFKMSIQQMVTANVLVNDFQIMINQKTGNAYVIDVEQSGTQSMDFINELAKELGISGKVAFCTKPSMGSITKKMMNQCLI